MSKAAGGNVAFNTAEAKVEIADKSAIIAIPMPKPSARALPYKAKTMNEALRHLRVEYDVSLRRSDGTSSKEKVTITELGDFDEDTIVEKSQTLTDQKKQMEFLFEFQYELNNNPVLVEEMKALLTGEKKKEVMEFLSRLKDQIKKRDPEFVNFLKS